MKILNIYTIKGNSGKLYQKEINNAIIRSQCDRYKHEEKASKFLILVLKKGMLFKIRLEPFHAMKKETISELFKFYKALFQKNIKVKTKRLVNVMVSETEFLMVELSVKNKVIESLLLSQSMLRDELLCSFKSASGKIYAKGIYHNRSIINM